MATFTSLLKVTVKQKCKPTADISDDGFTDFRWPLLFLILWSPIQDMNDTDTCYWSSENSSHNCCAFWIESPSQRVGHLRTSAHLQTKQEENNQAPPQGLLVSKAYLLRSLSGGWAIAPKGKRKAHISPINWDFWLPIRDIFNKHFNNAMSQALF